MDAQTGKDLVESQYEWSSTHWAKNMLELLGAGALPFDDDAQTRMKEVTRAKERAAHSTWWMRREAARAAGHVPPGKPGTCTMLGVDLDSFGRYIFGPDPEWLGHDPEVSLSFCLSVHLSVCVCLAEISLV